SDGESQMQQKQRKIDTLILIECGTEDYGIQELENNPEQIEIEITPINEDMGGHTRSIVINSKDRNAKEKIELGESYTL
ncbi:21318_t:CDS:2, partial [Gigaspora margarita]